MIAYRREIDGLRAFAVLPVILFHAGFETFSGGFVGVDVFFVISGYLIMSIILAEKEAGTFSLSNFWERRARRILPALFVVIAACIPAAFLLLDQFALRSFAASILATLFFVSNFHFWKDGGYFETAAELKPLLHTWSLAVEEQYYIIIPLLLLAIWKLGRRRIGMTLSAIACASFAYGLWATSKEPEAAFFLLPMRAWELLLGALIAFYHARTAPTSTRGTLLPEALSALGLVMIGFSILNYSSATPFPGIHALLPTVGAALIILFASQQTFVGRMLGYKALVGIGLISYSAYLWHQPLLAFLRHLTDDLGLIPRGITLILVFVLSLITWKYVEVPFRNKKRAPKQLFRKTVIPAGCLMLLTGIVGTQLFSSKVDTGAEVALAKALVGQPAVYVSNMDERKFIKNRIAVETLSPDTVIFGSSRMMQVSSEVTGTNSLNLSVSGGALQDYIALSRLALAKFKPTTIIIGADPWLFNAESGQKRWRSIASEYEHGLCLINAQPDACADKADKNHAPDRSAHASTFYDFYRSLNYSYLAQPSTDHPEARPKVRSDGSRVYDSTYSSRTAEQAARSAESVLDYSMKNYVFDVNLKRDFEKLIAYLKMHSEVVIALPPYHPASYEFMKSDHRAFLEVEHSFFEIGRSLGVEVIGSYNANAIGCLEADFYDGMHPKAACMEKLLEPVLK